MKIRTTTTDGKIGRNNTLIEGEQYRSILRELSRIADAFEEQNRASAESRAQNKAWRDEDEAIIQLRRDENMALERARMNIEQQILALHTRNFEREESHREKIRQTQEKQARDTDAHFTKAYKSWLASLKEQPHD